MNRKKFLKIRRSIKKLTDELGSLKEDKYLIKEQITSVTDELKSLYSQVEDDKFTGKFHSSVYESYVQKSTDWKRLAMALKPSKVRISKYTTRQTIKRIKTFER